MVLLIRVSVFYGTVLYSIARVGRLETYATHCTYFREFDSGFKCMGLRRRIQTISRYHLSPTVKPHQSRDSRDETDRRGERSGDDPADWDINGQVDIGLDSQINANLVS